MSRRRWGTPALPAALLAATVAVAACGGTAVTSPTPRSSGAPASPPATAAGSGAPAPTDTRPPAPSAPPVASVDELPEPTLTNPVDIATALASPAQRLQGVVSLLAGLGIGVRQADGEVLFEADASVTPTLWLSDGQVRGLAEMAAEEDARRIGFDDWHAGLVELGLELSADELGLAYEDAYFAGYEQSFLPEVLSATGVELFADGTLTHLQAWLLLLDGFVIRPAERADFTLVTNHETERWGGASATLPRLISPDAELTVEELMEVLAHIEPMVRAVPLTLAPASATVHEGHGQAGTPLDLVLRFIPYPPSDAPPPAIWPTPINRPEELPVAFTASDRGVLEEHGELRDADGGDPLSRGRHLTDDDGEIRLTYRPREEEANGEGETVEEIVQIAATVELRQIAERVWLLPPALLSMLHGERTVTTDLTIEWHEARGLRLDAVDVYDVQFDIGFGSAQRAGTDRFTGFLALQDDGTYRGTVEGTTSAAWRQDILGEECTTSLGGRQKLLAIAQLVPPDDEGRDLRIRFYPAQDPEVAPMQCSYELGRYEGNEYDPSVPREEWLPAREYAPFNDIRITMPDELALPARYPSGGRETWEYTEKAPGLGGGTWTITLEEVEPAP